MNISNHLCELISQCKVPEECIIYSLTDIYQNLNCRHDIYEMIIDLIDKKCVGMHMREYVDSRTLKQTKKQRKIKL